MDTFSSRVVPVGTNPPWVDTVLPGAYDYETKPASIHTIRSSSGWRSPTPWSHYVLAVWNAPYWEYTITSDQYGTKYEGHGSNFALSDTNVSSLAYQDSSALLDIAVNQALLNLSDQHADLGENIAEMHQADRMIGGKIDDYTSQLTGRYIAKHRRDWRRVKSVSPLVRHGLRYPASWLEFQYGIVPLLQDIAGSFEAVKRANADGIAQRVTVKGHAKEQDSGSVLIPSGAGSGGVSGAVGMMPLLYERSNHVFVRLDYALSNPALVALQQLGLVNPALLAWNLLPYSFVADWVLPVGNYLQAWTANLGWQFVGGSHSSMRRLKVNLPGEIILTPRPGYTQSASCSQGHGRIMSMSRGVYQQSPAPRMPHFKNPLSLRHTANALALLVTAFNRS